MMSSRYEFMESYWCSGDMTTTSGIQSLLTRDLDVRSSGSLGRSLLQRLEHYRLELLGAIRPLEFAQSLQDEDSRTRQRLEELLEWTGQEPKFRLVALVALAPKLDEVAERLGRGRPSADTIAEVLTQATDALRWTEELVEGERADFVIAHTSSRTRGEQRRMGRHNVPADPLPGDFDCEAKSVPCSNDSAAERLDHAVLVGIISSEERRLIHVTRTGESSLYALANLSDVQYDTLRFRRARAEDRLRRFYGVGE
jgi:hypothetical protein